MRVCSLFFVTSRFVTPPFHSVPPPVLRLCHKMAYFVTNRVYEISTIQEARYQWVSEDCHNVTNVTSGFLGLKHSFLASALPSLLLVPIQSLLTGLCKVNSWVNRVFKAISGNCECVLRRISGFFGIFSPQVVFQVPENGVFCLKTDSGKSPERPCIQASVPNGGD